MSLPINDELEVPGARLYYEVQGSGPVLMLVGHPMGTAGFATIAPLLADDYTVVSYDPRGFARSSIDDPEQDADPEVLADDVRRLLEAVGPLPAHVFGSSGGAVTGLALASRYPEHVATVVAHEPPVTLLLPDAEQARAAIHDLYETSRTRGIGVAWEQFAAFTQIEMSPPENAEPGPPAAEAVATSRRFFAHGLLPIALYEPDLAALLAAPCRIVAAGGTSSRGQLAQRCAAALAERLGSPLVEFPGGHGGFLTDSEEFAAVLRRTLAEP